MPGHQRSADVREGLYDVSHCLVVLCSKKWPKLIFHWLSERDLDLESDFFNFFTPIRCGSARIQAAASRGQTSMKSSFMSAWIIKWWATSPDLHRHKHAYSYVWICTMCVGKTHLQKLLRNHVAAALDTARQEAQATKEDVELVRQFDKMFHIQVNLISQNLVNLTLIFTSVKTSRIVRKYWR